MSDKPIIFSAPMVRAILEGRKTQTRRVVRQPDVDAGQHWHRYPAGWFMIDAEDAYLAKTPYQTGDRLYVREAHSLHRAHGQDFKRPADDHGVRWGPWSGLPIAVSPDKTQVAYYRQGFDRSGPPKWRPSIHMPRWASRLTLTVTDVRVQRLQEISEADAVAEGVDDRDAVCGYSELWDTLHGPGAWDMNPWVAAYTFTVQHGNIDMLAERARQ